MVTFAEESLTRAVDQGVDRRLRVSHSVNPATGSNRVTVVESESRTHTETTYGFLFHMTSMPAHRHTHTQALVGMQ